MTMKPDLSMTIDGGTVPSIVATVGLGISRGDVATRIQGQKPRAEGTVGGLLSFVVMEISYLLRRVHNTVVELMGVPIVERL